jgi:GAF domain-containing protein
LSETLGPGEANHLATLSELALRSRAFDQFATEGLPHVAALARSPVALLYVADARLTAPAFLQHGLPPETAAELGRACEEECRRFLDPAVPARLPLETLAGVRAGYALRAEGTKCLGFIAVATAVWSPVWPGTLRLMAQAVDHLAERVRGERRLAHLNAYLTLSSMLAQTQGLHDVLEVALYGCMETVAAEAASVLLLDDERANFSFYQVEGPAKPVLSAVSFPADKGLAAAVIRSRQAEIINQVQSDPRFFSRVDTDSGFQTRNMIALPLIAGDEPVGVLEVLNKAQGGLFTEEDRLLLLSIAEEIAYAIRNARIFEYVVKSYCKQIQGQGTCRGCQRPLGSWTPCAKYREAEL